MHDGALELFWFKQLYMDLGLIEGDFTLTVFKDNQANDSSKHMAVRYQQISRDLAQTGLMVLAYGPTMEQLADVLTKNVTVEIFWRLAPFLNMPHVVARRWSVKYLTWSVWLLAWL